MTFAWPAGLTPADAPVFVRNELRVAAAPEAVWAWLVRAPLWPSYYANARDVVLPGGATALAAGMSFAWTTSGLPLRSQVREFEPARRLAWDARSPLILAYHGWSLEPDGDGTHVVTEETQRGLLPRVLGFALRPRMLAVHRTWLEGLAARAVAGAPAG